MSSNTCPWAQAADLFSLESSRLRYGEALRPGPVLCDHGGWCQHDQGDCERGELPKNQHRSSLISGFCLSFIHFCRSFPGFGSVESFGIAKWSQVAHGASFEQSCGGVRSSGIAGNEGLRS